MPLKSLLPALPIAMCVRTHHHICVCSMHCHMRRVFAHTTTCAFVCSLHCQVPYVFAHTTTYAFVPRTTTCHTCSYKPPHLRLLAALPRAIVFFHTATYGFAPCTATCHMCSHIPPCTCSLDCHMPHMFLYTTIFAFARCHMPYVFFHTTTYGFALCTAT